MPRQSSRRDRLASWQRSITTAHARISTSSWPGSIFTPYVSAIENHRSETCATSVPPRVKLRIFERFKGACYLSNVKIQPGDTWELEHIIALCNGGTHSESNMAPALTAPHKVKTKADMRAKTKNERIRKRFAGIKPARKITRWRKKPSFRFMTWKKKLL